MKIKVNQEELVFDHELTAYEALASTGPVSREIIACEIDGKVCGLTTVITNDCSLKPLTFQDARRKKGFLAYGFARFGAGSQTAISRNKTDHRPRH